MKFKNILNPKIFTKDNELKPEVAKKLKEIAHAFIETMEIPMNSIKEENLP